MVSEFQNLEEADYFPTYEISTIAAALIGVPAYPATMFLGIFTGKSWIYTRANAVG